MFNEPWNSRTDSKEGGNPGCDVVDYKMPTIIYSSHKEGESISPLPTCIWVGNMTCFGQGDISKH